MSLANPSKRPRLEQGSSLVTAPLLKHIEIGNSFNQRVDHLPPFLTSLNLGDCFNQAVDNLPPSLMHLTLGNDFNQSLPPNLIKLHLGTSFTKYCNHLPNSITHLTLPFSKDFLVDFPSRLNILKVTLQEYQVVMTFKMVSGRLSILPC